MIVSMSAIKPSKEEHLELRQRAASHAGRVDDASRARLICCPYPPLIEPGRLA